MDPRLEQSVITRLLDQCALDDSVLVALCGDDPAHAAHLAGVKRRLALRKTIKNMPFVGFLVRSIRQRTLQGRRFK